jgi:hypothetical protein
MAPGLLINSTVINFNGNWISELPTPPSNLYHRDIWHSWSNVENSIAYGVTAADRVVFNDRINTPSALF